MSEAPILLIFDFDNTLIDSRIDFARLREALIDLLAAATPLPATRESLRRRPIRDLLEAAPTPEGARAMWRVVEAFEAEGLREAAPMPHAAPVLRSLAARGFRLALLTNNARGATLGLLDRLGFADALDLTVTRDDVPALKPDPAGVRQIVERLGPARAAFLIGDSWIDGLAAQAAGVRFVGFGLRREEAEARGVTAWAWITDLRELLSLDWAA